MVSSVKHGMLCAMHVVSEAAVFAPEFGENAGVPGNNANTNGS